MPSKITYNHFSHLKIIIHLLPCAAIVFPTYRTKELDNRTRSLPVIQKDDATPLFS